jgi:hypothetical protein
LFGNNVWFMGMRLLPNPSTYSLAVIWPWRVIIGPTEYHDRISPVFHCWNQAFLIVDFLGCSPNINSHWCREQLEGRLIWPYQARISSCLMSRFYGRDTIVYASEHYFHKRRFSSCSPTVDVEFLKLTLDSLCENRVLEMNEYQFFCHLCCSSCVIVRNNPSQCTMISFCQRWFLPTVPLRLCCLAMIRVCWHNLRNCHFRYT